MASFVLSGPLKRAFAVAWAIMNAFVIFSAVHPAGGDSDGWSDVVQAGIEQDFDHYMDYPELTEHLETLVERHKDISMVFSVGKTYEGRDIWCVKVSDRVMEEDDGGEEPEPNVLLVGAHHGNEWISYEVPLFVLGFLLENYGGPDANGSMATNIVDGRETYIIPMLNVDGVQYSFDTGNGFRKNREPNYLSDFLPVGGADPEVRPTSYGVDINRNYGWMWHLAQGSNALNQAGSSYRGAPDNVDDDGDALTPVDWRPGYTEPGPDDGVDEDPWDGVDNDGDGETDEDPAGGFTSAEAQAMRALGEEKMFDALITYHSFSELVLWPWGYTSDPSPDDALFETLGVRLAELNGYTPMQGYDLYMTSGEMTDWFYAVYGSLAYTFEIGRTYAPAESEILGECARNLEASMYLCHAAKNPFESYIRFDPNSTSAHVVGGRAHLSVTAEDDGYPVAFAPGSCSVVYRFGQGRDATAPLVSDGNGTWSASIPIGEGGGDIEYYYRFEDVEGGEVTYPIYAPDMRLIAEVQDYGSFLGIGGPVLLGLIAAGIIVAGGAAGTVMMVRRWKRNGKER